MNSVCSPIHISIITPSYNQGQYIEQTIDSVLSQNYPHLDYIIIDGGSTDNSVEIIKKYEKHLSYWVSEKDNGQSHAINKGFSRAKGEVINWLNSDDYYLPGALKTVSEYFQDKNINVLCGKSQIVKNGKLVKISSGTDIYLELSKTIGWARTDQPETFYRKSCIDSIGVLNQGLHYVMDKELWIRYLCKYGLRNVKQTDDLLVAFRLHGSSKTTNQQSLFDKETGSLFQKFALEYGLDNEVKVFSDLGNVSDEVERHIFEGLEVEEANRVLQYYFLQQAFRLYALNDFNSSQYFLKQIDFSQISESDKIEIQKISDRMKYPVALKKLINLYNKIRK